MNKKFWIGVAILIVAGIILILVLGPSTPTNTSTIESDAGTIKANPTVISDVTSVPISVLESIGVGTASTPKSITGSALKKDSKPEVLYAGAEYCPYCATERWAMTVALSHFGTFTGIKQTHSSTTDVYPDTQTLSFYGSTFTSPYVTFTPIEMYTNIPDDGGYTTLQTPTSAQQNIINKYDSEESIPFIDFGNRYLIEGATYSPSVLQGKTALQIASSLSNPDTAIAKGADGAANTMIAAICKLTDNQPTDVCTTSTITTIEDSLK